MDIIEGFYFKVKNGAVFYAKGSTHPPDKVFAYPKYVPTIIDEKEVRCRDGECFTKLETIDDQLNYVSTHLPEYLEYDPYIDTWVPKIPLKDIVLVFNPIRKARDILSREHEDPTLRIAKELLKTLIEGSNIRNIGVSGSILVGLHTKESDIDVVVYGDREGLKVYEFLKQAIEDASTGFRRYDEMNLLRLYEFRKRETPMDFQAFVLHERRRVLEGLFRGREYFVRLVKKPNRWEEYGRFMVRKLGEATIRARVEDSSESIYTPCRYIVKDVEVLDGVKVNVDEIYSLRGRFCEIANCGDIIVAHGIVEKVYYFDLGKEVYRLHLVSKGHYMVNISLIKR